MDGRPKTMKSNRVECSYWWRKKRKVFCMLSRSFQSKLKMTSYQFKQNLIKVPTFTTRVSVCSLYNTSAFFFFTFWYFWRIWPTLIHWVVWVNFITLIDVFTLESGNVMFCSLRSCKSNYVKLFNSSNSDRQGKGHGRGQKSNLVKKICGSDDNLEIVINSNKGVLLEFR